MGASPLSALGVKRVNFLCSQPHYVDHMLPVYLALPVEMRGEFHIGEFPTDPKALTVVSSWGDYLKTEGPVIFFEHGAGFSYGETRHPSYAGGPGRERTVLFCNTNKYVDDKNAGAYPDIPNVIVGCPKLDVVANQLWTPPKYPAVAYSFHWDCHVAPETRSAFPHYKPYFDNMLRGYGANATRYWNMIGHGHPLAWHQLSPVWKKLGATQMRHFSDVLNHANVYVCDTSSTTYEFAAAGRPVVVLNAPWYRRNVRHGIRFWENVPGIQVDHPSGLDAAIKKAVFDDTWAAERRRITEVVYPFLGESAARAAGAIRQLLS